MQTESERRWTSDRDGGVREKGLEYISESCRREMIFEEEYSKSYTPSLMKQLILQRNLIQR